MTLKADFKQVYGPWAVVTGASAGIGAEFAAQLAAAGLHVALVARRADRLAALADELTAAHGVKARPIAADLGTAVGVAATLAETASLDVGLLVNNAGVEHSGAFGALDAATHQETIDLNVTASKQLAHAFARRFVARNRAAAQLQQQQQQQHRGRRQEARRSGIIMLSSIGRHMMPYHAVYSASKAYMRALSVSLRGELEPERINVTSLEPGFVASEMADRIKQNVAPGMYESTVIPAERCVSEALAAFERGEAWHTPGWASWFNSRLSEFVPPRFAAALMAPMMKKNMSDRLLEYPPQK